MTPVIYHLILALLLVGYRILAYNISISLSLPLHKVLPSLDNTRDNIIQLDFSDIEHMGKRLKEMNEMDGEEERITNYY